VELNTFTAAKLGGGSGDRGAINRGGKYGFRSKERGGWHRGGKLEWIKDSSLNTTKEKKE